MAYIQPEKNTITDIRFLFTLLNVIGLILQVILLFNPMRLICNDPLRPTTVTLLHYVMVIDRCYFKVINGHIEQ